MSPRRQKVAPDADRLPTAPLEGPQLEVRDVKTP